MQFQELKAQHPKILNQVDEDQNPKNHEWEKQRRTVHSMSNVEVDLDEPSQLVMETGTKAKTGTKVAHMPNQTMGDDPIQEDLFKVPISKEDRMTRMMNALMREMRETKLQLQETTQRTQQPKQATLPQPSRLLWHDEYPHGETKPKEN